MSQSQDTSSPAPKRSLSVGSVFGKRKRGRPAKPKVTSPSVPESPITDTSATVMGETMTLEKSLSSSTSAPTTTGSSSSSTDSLMSPSGYVENGLSPSTDELRTRLRPESFQKLSDLAEARGEPLSTTLDEIMRFLCEEESEYAEAPVDEAIEYYLSVSFI